MHNIILLSSERSGSNLLRLMFNSHSQISGPAAPHIAKHLAPYIHLYGDLSSDKKLVPLIEDMLALTKIQVDPWRKDISVEYVLKEIRTYTFWEVYQAIFSLNAKCEGKHYWFNKENNLFDYAFEILHSLSGFKFIYLVRDGRDYACSMKKVLGGHSHYYQIANQWKNEQLKCLRIYTQLKKSESIYLLYYEDLIAKPEETLRELVNFAGFDYEENMLNYFNSDYASLTASKTASWENLSKPVMNSNSGKFKTQMSAKDIRLFESIAGDELRLLGYNATGGSLKEVDRVKKLLYIIINKLTMIKNSSSLMNEPNRLERAKLLKSIKQRLNKEA